MNNEENNEENVFKSFYAEEVSKHQNTKHSRQKNVVHSKGK